MLGVADLLLYGSQVLSVAEHRRAAERVAEQGLLLARGAGAWPCGTMDRAESPGLMLGLSGIGAVLLRLEGPDDLPPVGLLVHSTSRKARPDAVPSSG